MHRLLERLDTLGSTIVPLAYLTGLFLGTAAYFSGLVANAGIAVGIGIAVGSELHSFLAQRRCRAAYAEYQRVRREEGEGSPLLEALQGQLRGQVLILALLISFQVFTAVGFTAATWHPAPGYLPGWLQIAIRGCVIPFLFLLSGFLIPLQQSPGAVLEHASGEILHYAVSRNVRHWRKRIRRVHRKGGDLSPLMVALLEQEGEAGAAQRTALIATNLQDAEAQIHARSQGGLWSRMAGRVQQPDSLPGALLGPAVPVTPAAAVSVHAGPEEDPDPDPDPDPRGPAGAPRPSTSSSRRTQGRARGRALQLVSDQPARQRQRRGGNPSRAMEDNAQLRAQRIRQARAILSKSPRISAVRLGEIIGAPKTVALTIAREIRAEARGARQATTAQQQTQPLQQQQLDQQQQERGA